MRRLFGFVLLLAVGAVAVSCLDTAALDYDFCDPGEPCYGGTGGNGGNCPVVPAGKCPDPLLAYDPAQKDIENLAPMGADVGDVVVGRLDPFGQNTRCGSMVVGLRLSGGGQGCNKFGETLYVTAFDGSDHPVAAPMVKQVTLDLNHNPPTPTSVDGVYSVKVPYASEHVCGVHPFVGVRLEIATCLAFSPATCDSANAFRWNAETAQWGSVAASGPAQIYIGLADCSPM